jgi:hypothetical protein
MKKNFLGPSGPYTLLFYFHSLKFREAYMNNEMRRNGAESS